MTLLRKGTFIALVCLVSACDTIDMVTRSAPLSATSFELTEPQVMRSYDIQDVVLRARSNLLVSESNSFFPSADVVWRGDPMGDRVAQVLGMFDTALSRNAASMTGLVPVRVEISLNRFHGVTERTRYTVGGNYDIHFDLAVYNAETGELIEAPREVQINLAAPGGTAAFIQDRRGETEKVRVTEFLTIQLRQALTGAISV